MENNKKHHSIGVYPMYLTERITLIENEAIKKMEITAYSVEEINKGDTYSHKRVGNDFTVSEVLEHKFPAKGDHKQETHWYRLLLTR